MENPGHRNHVTGMRAGGPAHAARATSARATIVVTGVLAAAVAAGVGAASLLRAAHPVTSAPTSAQLMQVEPTFPVDRGEIVDVTRRVADLGELGGAGRLASCLQGLRLSSSTHLLGARPIQAGGKDAILLVLPGQLAGQLSAVAVRPECDSSAPGRISDTTVSTP